MKTYLHFLLAVVVVLLLAVGMGWAQTKKSVRPSSESSVILSAKPTQGIVPQAAKRPMDGKARIELKEKARQAKGRMVSSMLSTVHYVETTGSDATGNGTSGNPWATIKYAVVHSVAGDAIWIGDGTFVETGQIVIDKDLWISGGNGPTGVTIIKKAEDTGDPSSGNARAWFLVTSAVTAEFELGYLTLDGTGRNISIGVLSYAAKIWVHNCDIKNIGWYGGGPPDYYGRGIAVYGGVSPDANQVGACSFENIGRIGVFSFYSTVLTNITECTYTGKGPGDWLDYAFEAGGGAEIDVYWSSISACRGVASVDGSTSAGILGTTYFGGGTAASAEWNFITDCTVGAAIGYDASDATFAVVRNNNLVGNTNAVSNSAPANIVNAPLNWYGSNSATVVAAQVGTGVHYSSWLDSGTNVSTDPGFQPDLSILWVDDNSPRFYPALGLIQEGIDWVSGSTVHVAAGTYNENQIVINKAVSLIGAGSATTIIDGGKYSSLTNYGTIFISSISSGSVLVQGFTIRNAGYRASDPEPMLIVVGGGAQNANVTIQNNHFIGWNNTPSDLSDMGFWRYHSEAGTTTIQNNEFEQMWQAILLERPRGGAAVVNNNFHNLVPTTSDGTTYEPQGMFIFSYFLNNDVTNPVQINNNSFTSYNGQGIAIGGGYGGYVPAKFTDVHISDNAINCIGSGPERRHVGITLINYGANSSEADAGGVRNVTISGNTVTTGGPDSYGILLWGKNTNISVQDNTISNLNKGLAVEEKYSGAGFASSVVAHYNCITGNTLGVSNGSAEVANLVDAENNWWGAADGPSGVGPGSGDAVSANVDFNPWRQAIYSGGTLFPVSPTPNVVLQATFKNSANVGITGTVNFYIDNTLVGSSPTDGNGVATLTGITKSVGVYLVRAVLGCMDANALIAVYYPTAGFVTGGGWIMSPAGAWTADLDLTGKANFGFVSKYEKGKTAPTGNTEFQFQVANLNFKSTVYEWLVVSGARAQYKGSGTINGTGQYGFLLTAIDGQINGGTGTDKFRIKIWDKSTSNVVYDNQIGAVDNADPTTVLGGGQIVIQTAKKKEVSENQAEEMQLAFVPTQYALFECYPNPFNPTTTIRFDIPTGSVVTLKVYDVLGREVAALVDGQYREAGRYDVKFDASQLGSGVYFYRITAGSFTSVRKMLLMK